MRFAFHVQYFFITSNANGMYSNIIPNLKIVRDGIICNFVMIRYKKHLKIRRQQMTTMHRVGHYTGKIIFDRSFKFHSSFLVKLIRY